MYWLSFIVHILFILFLLRQYDIGVPYVPCRLPWLLVHLSEIFPDIDRFALVFPIISSYIHRILIAARS